MKNKNIIQLLAISFLLAGCDTTGNFRTPLNKNTDEKILSKLVESTSHIKNVILFIGDGMGFNSIKAGEYFENLEYDFTHWQKAKSNTNSIAKNGKSKNSTTDSAAGGTALSTGQLTKDGIIAKDKDGNDLETLITASKKKSRATGVVTSDNPNGATPASFSAHSISRGNEMEILESQASNNDLDLLIGNYNDTYDQNKEKFINNGYTYSTSLDNSLLKAKKLIVNNQNMVPFGETNSLFDSVKYAVNYLQNDENGFTLMIEQAHIDKYSHKNDFDGMVNSVIELNKCVSYVSNLFRDRDDTMILITADHETGKLKVKNNKSLKHKVTNNGHTFSYKYKKTGHSKTPVPVYIWGPKVNFEYFTAFRDKNLIKNCEIGFLLKHVIERY